MYTALCLLALVLARTGDASPQSSKPGPVEANTAFFEGETYNYVIEPPAGFVMNTEESRLDGYSFAFVPRKSPYDSARVIIGVNFFRIRGISFEKALTQDTISLREYLDSSVSLEPQPLQAQALKLPFHIFAINDKSPVSEATVLFAYCNGITEMLIFDLTITSDYPRSKAESAFYTVLENLKTLKPKNYGVK